MEKTIDKRIEKLLDNEQIKEILKTAGKGKIAPVIRVSNLIGEVYTLGKSIAQRLNIDLSSGSISKENEQRIQEKRFTEQEISKATIDEKDKTKSQLQRDK